MEFMKRLSVQSDVFFRASVLTIISVYAFFFSEWLFFATKPSFLTSLSTFEGLSALFVVVIPVALLVQLAMVFTWALSLIGERTSLKLYIIYMFPALVVAATIFLLIENFTYTLFHFNVGSLDGVGRYFYGISLVALGLATLEYFVRQDAENWGDQTRWWLSTAGSLLAMSTIFFMINIATYSENRSQFTIGKGGKQPNILILSTDGMSATNTSAYGYKRPTTEFLEKFKKESLYAENSYTNCAHTSCSITSMLTGKMPMNTRVIFPPDILTGKDAYEHLPGILQRAGYKTIDISVRHYADAYDLNIRRGFDYSNSRTENLKFVSNSNLWKLQKVAGDSGYFLRQSYERLQERILHLLGLQEMQNPYHAVTQPWRSQRWRWNGSDPKRVDELLSFISGNKGRYFIHVHFMDTHGARFSPRKPFFSKGKKQKRDWMVDFYDDSIRDFDSYVHKIVDHLKKTGTYNNTIIIITSDHGKNRTTHHRLPLMIRFPGGAHKGVIRDNVQRLDIAPTILDYLGATIPEWMDGKSFLENKTGRYRPIYSAFTIRPKRFRNGLWAVVGRPPPFYSLGSLAMVVCDKWYRMSLKTGKISIKSIEGHTQICEPGALPNAEQAKEKLLKRLSRSGYRINEGEFEKLVREINKRR